MFRAITGPTGIGKSAFAERLSRHWSKIIVNADPFQFYQEIKIINNRTEFNGIKTHFLADRSLKDFINAGDYSRLSQNLIDVEALWVGTGLYLGAALYGLDPTGEKGTPFQGKPKSKYKILVMDEERPSLYGRLDERVDQMILNGAEEEARDIYQMILREEIQDNHPILKAIGLKHLLDYFKNGSTWKDCVLLWKRDSRRLAKRQWTWLRKFCPPSKDILWKQRETLESEVSEISDFLEIARSPRNL